MMAHRRVARALVRRWSGTIRVADPAWITLRSELDRWRGEPATFWWRDDDAVAATPALDRLLALRARLDIPLALAVIPARAEPSLAAATGADGTVTILVHGWDHCDHPGAGGHPSEFPAGRSASEMRAQLDAGRARLARLFGARLLPVLVPPFNRIAPALHRVVADAGFDYVSADGDFFAFALPARNVHADVIDWQRGTARGAGDVVRSLVAALRLRRLGVVPRARPIGIMTHHLVHDEATWALTETLLGRAAEHASVAFPSVASLFPVPAIPNTR